MSIVKSCRKFSESDGTRTGLVVGYVQSGKTQSMTAVSSLARDNGCRIIILLAGVTNILLNQSAKRFREALRGASGRATAWRIFNSADGFAEPELRDLQRAIAEWNDPVFKDDRQTLLYVVLKNHGHLDQLYWLLSRASLEDIPALIIDDEADQAGLNTSPEESEASTTYSRIARVRSALPHHTYLQYTATPQAPLLIALDDMLSPAFAELIEPGDAYTGGQAFFGPSSTRGLVHTIPDEDLFKAGKPPDEPPESLLEALRVFFVGCAVATLRGRPTLRSMLVHPSARTSDHSRYVWWIDEIVKRWATSLRSKVEVDRRDALDELRAGYDELARTDAELPPFEKLTHPILISLGRVSLKEINSQDGTEIDWDNADEHILVGGEKLNRGFTVEGLTVTYMPRDAGGWSADTIQQRARFFGYKAGYLSLCRLYLHPDVVSAFRSYVRHEDDIRKQLAAHRGQPLREWRRAFFLDAQMRPTRTNVLSDPYYKIPRDRVWFSQRFPQDADTAKNAASVRALEAGLSFSRQDAYFNHVVAEVPLKQLYSDLLVSFDVRGADVPAWYGQLVTIGDIMDANHGATAVVVRMEGSQQGFRLRSEDKSREITLHQGRSSSKDKQGKYPGDKEMKDSGRVTVQIHWVNVEGGAQGVAGLAIYIPSELRKDDIGASVLR
ncbi:MAG: Z1 domain-containing protein [Kofleriaceae bacterium]